MLDDHSDLSNLAKMVIREGLRLAYHRSSLRYVDLEQHEGNIFSLQTFMGHLVEELKSIAFRATTIIGA